MPLKRIHHRVNSRAANERHQHVDVRGRIDLGEELTADTWLAVGIREKRGVEQRDERGFDLPSRSIREKGGDRLKYLGRRCERLVRQGIVTGGGHECSKHRVDEPESHIDALGLSNRAERAFDLTP